MQAFINDVIAVGSPADILNRRLFRRVKAGDILLPVVLFATVLLSISLAKAMTGVSPLWMPIAILAAALIRHGAFNRKILIGGMTAIFAANLASGLAPPDGLVQMLMNGLGASLLAYALSRKTDDMPWYMSRRQICWFALLSVGVSAILATLGASWRSAVHGAIFEQVWPEWFASNALGFLIGTPLILSWTEPALQKPLTSRSLLDAAGMMIIVGAAAYVSFTTSLALPFLVFPVLAAVTVRSGLPGATAGLVAFAAVALACMINGVGPIATMPNTSLFMKMLVLRAYLMTGVLSTLPIAVTLTLRDMLAAKLQRQDAISSAALGNMIQGLAMFDADNRLIICNRRFADIYGLREKETTPGTLLTEMVLADGRPLMQPPHGRFETDGELRGQIELPDGRIIEMQCRLLPDHTWIATHEDVTDKRLADRRIAHLANHDPLTDLANRAAFRNELDRLVEALDFGESFALHSIDLDRFKAVNDTLGHGSGDELLRQVANRLRQAARNSDFIARLGGDEFAIIQSPIRNPEEAESLASRIVESICRPFDIHGQEALIGASVGIAHVPQDGRNQVEILQKSDLALYRAKSDGRNRYCLYEPGMDELLQQRRALETELRAAIQKGQFILHYQPVLDIESGTIRTVEALIRWQHPKRGLLDPTQFISVAEETGLIIPIGEWVLRHACREAATWPSDVRLAVNVSSIQFKSRNMFNLIMSALSSAGLPPERLEIEITESLLLENTEELLSLLNQLHVAGVNIAMDDFGTGYSSLSYLRTFPFDKIKIDKSFVRDLGSKNGEALAIIHATAQLSREFGMRTTAEGVETAEQLEILKAQGCAEVQGYFFSAPISSDHLRGLLSAPALQEKVSNFMSPGSDPIQLPKPRTRRPAELPKRTAAN